MKDRQADPLAPTAEPVRKRPTRESLAQPATLTAGLALVGAIYLAREILIPITLAVIFSFLVAPLVRILQRLYINQAIAILVSVVVPLFIVVSIAGVVGSQVAQLAQGLPQYQETINAKLESIQTFANGSVGQFLGRAGQVIERVSSGQPPTAAPVVAVPTGSTRAARNVAPLPAPVAPPEPHGPPIQLVGHFLSALLGPVETAAIVFILSIFMLFERETVRDRFIKLTGVRDSARTTIALDDTAARLSRYFLSQLGVNTSVGLVIGIGLEALGAPSPVLWGVLAAALRFIPYVGVWIAAILAALLAAAIDPGWSMVLWTIGLFGATEMIASQLVEPLLYGHTTGLSPLSVVIAAIFWSWLWGPVGLILSTPLTLCLVVLGRYVERLNFLEIMLGEKPNVRSSQELYERLADGHDIDVIMHAEGFLAKNTGIEYFDQVLIPAFRLISEASASEALTPDALERAKKAAGVLVDALPERLSKAKRSRAKRTGAGQVRVLCAPCTGPLDALLATAIAVLLHDLKIDTVVTGPSDQGTDAQGARIVVVALANEPLRDGAAMASLVSGLAARGRVVGGIYTEEEIKREMRSAHARLERTASAKQIVDAIYSTKA